MIWPYCDTAVSRPNIGSRTITDLTHHQVPSLVTLWENQVLQAWINGGHYG